MTTLREKIDALAAPCTCHDDYKRRGREDSSCRHHDEQDAALAAARLALEHAAEVCKERGDALVAKWDKYDNDMADDAKARAWDCLQCAAAIRAEAAKIGADA